VPNYFLFFGIDHLYKTMDWVDEKKQDVYRDEEKQTAERIEWIYNDMRREFYNEYDDHLEVDELNPRILFE
jgi:hypothetical protein